MDESGLVIVVWSGPRPEGEQGIWGRAFPAEGQAPAPEAPMLLSLGPARHETPAIAADGQGRAWLAWRLKNVGHPGVIVARRLSQSLTGTHAFPVTEDDGTDATEPVVAAGTDGRAFFAWTSRRTGEPPRVRARVLWTDGQPVGGEALIRRRDGLARHSPSVAADPSGGFVLVYAVGEPGEEQAVVMERFTVSGGRRGEPVTISEPGAVKPSQPAVAAAGDSIVVAWRQVDPGGRAITMARRIDSEGRPGPAVRIGAGEGGSHGAHAVAAADEGRFAVAFNGDEAGGAGIFLQLFGSDASVQPPCIRLAPAGATGEAKLTSAGTARLALAGDGTLVCAWIGTVEPDSRGAYLTELSPVTASR